MGRSKQKKTSVGFIGYARIPNSPDEQFDQNYVWSAIASIVVYGMLMMFLVTLSAIGTSRVRENSTTNQSSMQLDFGIVGET